jgi:hypothetical protein
MVLIRTISNARITDLANGNQNLEFYNRCL